MTLAIVLTVLSAAQQIQHSKRDVAVIAQEVKSFEQQSKLALLVGVGDYSEASGLSRVQFAANDVNALAAELRQQGYVVRSLIDSAASRGVVRKALRDLGGAVDEEQGTVLFYFAGHGFARTALIIWLFTEQWPMTSKEMDYRSLT